MTVRMTAEEMKLAALFRRARRTQKATKDPAVIAAEQEKIDQARKGLKDYWRRLNREQQLKGNR